MSSMNRTVFEWKKIVSENECFDIVKKTLNRDDVKIRDIEVFGDSSVFGFLGEYFRLVIHIEDQKAPSSDRNTRLIYFVKSLPIDNQIKRKHIESYGMFKKEWFMYNYLLPKFAGRDEGSTQWRANCYLSRPDLLVLDDFTELGYKHLPYRSRFNEFHVKCCLKNVAKLHADSIYFVESHLQGEKFEEKFAEYLIETSITEDNQWFLCGLQAIKGCAPLASNFEKFKEIFTNEEFDKRMQRAFEIVKPSEKFRNVFCHQDLWANNIMFKFGNKPNSAEEDVEQPINCVFMDFQFYRYAPPALDVLQLVLMTTRLNHRRAHYEEYFKYYHDCLGEELKSFGVDVESQLPWKEFRMSCDELRLYPLIYNCVATPLVFQSPEKQLKLKNGNPELFQNILLVNRLDYMLESMAEDDVFKNVVMENIDELLDYMFDETI